MVFAGLFAPSVKVTQSSSPKSGPLLTARDKLKEALDIINAGQGKDKLRVLIQAAADAVDNAINESKTPTTHRLSELAPGERTDVETANWLQSTFTPDDPLAAEQHFLARVSSRAMRNTRTVSADLRQSISAALVAPAVADMLETTFGTLRFDALAYGAMPECAGRPVTIAGTHILGEILDGLVSEGAVREANVFQNKVQRFLRQIDGKYLKVPYHNSLHGVDVMSSVEFFAGTDLLHSNLTVLDRFLLAMSAAGHDVGHPGLNELFQVKTMSNLALRYNDRSVLENLHSATFFQIMREDEDHEAADWLSLLHGREAGECNQTQSVRQYVRKAIVRIILATDMTKHRHHVSALKEFVHESEEHHDESEVGKQAALERKLFLLETALHAGDISPPCRPRPIMLSWSRRILEESWAQGDREKNLGLELSPMCDRAAGRSNVSKSQLGFIGFVVQPFWEPLALMMPEVEAAMEFLLDNKAFWQEQDSKNANADDVFAGVV